MATIVAFQWPIFNFLFSLYDVFVIRILFEEPFWLAITLLPVLFVLWGIWNRTRTTSAARALLAGLIAAPLLFVTQWLVVTDREKLERTTKQLSQAVERSDIDGVIKLIDPDVKFDGTYDREQFKDHLTYLLEKYTVEDPSVYGFLIELAGDHATVRCSARCRVNTPEWTSTVPSSWELTFKLTGDRWLITNLRPLKIADRNYDSFFGID